jgi:hypothetical protein
VLAETFHFDRALPLGKRIERGGGYDRANDYAQGVFQFHP